ncbi:MAG: alkylhydroperoxidase [Acidiferrobacter sp.]|nr:alkylhydroperoxidase [Acidiferrobacter sp.]MEC9079106.1 peroxidase-related enzyme [Pseudomonadota bacterium]
MTAWIRMIEDQDADPELLEILKLARTPHGTVDNVMRVHSLRPNTMKGHVILYRAALHDDANTLPMWLQEVIGSYVSLLNDCDYSYANHWANAKHLMGDDAKADAAEAALKERKPEDAFEGKTLAFLRYAQKLTLTPGEMARDDVTALTEAGVDDGEILEANQIIGYFNYVNRCLNGLGVTTEGDIVGYYSSSDSA